MRCTESKTKTSFYKQSVFSMLKFNILEGEMFEYKLQQCKIHHIMNKMNDYECMNQTHSDGRQFLTRLSTGLLLYPCMWAEKNHVTVRKETDHISFCTSCFSAHLHRIKHFSTLLWRSTCPTWYRQMSLFVHVAKSHWNLMNYVALSMQNAVSMIIYIFNYVWI